MGRAAGGRREHYLVCHGVRDPSRSHETLSILGAPSTKVHNDVAALLVGSIRRRRVRPASPVLRVSASICFKKRIGWPCGLQRLRPLCRRRRASNQSGKTGLRNGASILTPMAMNPTLMHGFSRRASPPNTKPPRDHRTCPYVVQFHFQDRSRRASSNTSLRSLISAIENARFTCHRPHAPLPHADSSAGVRYSARHRRAGPNGMLQHSASPASPGLDHERAEDSRRANDGPLAESSQRRRGASRRSFPTTPYGAAAERRE